MKEAYQLSTQFSSVIEDPRVQAVIKECGGKMYMSEKKWDTAYEEFFASFKNYNDMGSADAQTLLKYVILCAMLSRSSADVMEIPEAKTFASDKEINLMVQLSTAFKQNDIASMQEVLGNKEVNLLEDKFIATYL